MILIEKIVNTDKFGGRVDIITGIDDFKETCKFDEKLHCYTVNGKKIPSVSRLLDDGSYDNVNPFILRQAQIRGTLIHKEVENYLKYNEKGYTDELYEFIELFNNNKDIFNSKAIYDIKTFANANKNNKEKCLKQLEMYSEAIEYLTGIKIDDLYMIHLPKNKKGKLIKLK